MKLLKKFTRLFTDDILRFVLLEKAGYYDKLDDITYLKKKYKVFLKKELNLDNPVTFNEKLQWLKLNNRKPEYTTMVDKFEVRKYIEKVLGEDYLIPLLGVWDDPNEINFENLPNQFVLKCNHNSGLGMCICKDKSKLNIKKVKKELKKGIKENYFLRGREWPYKNVKPRIIAEQYIVDSNGELNDYKFTCFNGNVDNVMICLDRFSGDTKFYFFNKDWKLLRINKRGKEAPENFSLPKPQNLEKMFDIAAKLSEGIPFSRIDLYNVDGKIYFGEITFFPDSGFDPNLLEETNLLFGSKINLESEK